MSDESEKTGEEAGCGLLWCEGAFGNCTGACLDPNFDPYA